MSSLPRSAFVAITLALVSGCGSAPPRAVTPAAPAKPVETAKVADPSPNTLRDRRTQAGVRAPAKPLVIGGASGAKCGKLGKGGDEADLLGGRFRVRGPSGGKVPPPHADAPSVEEESRIVAETPKLSLAVVARETFQLDPDLYEAEPEAPAKPATLDVEAAKFLKATFGKDEALEVVPVEIGPEKLRGYAARPPHPNAPPGKDTALVLALLVAQEDGALTSVAFYVRGDTVRDATGDDLVGCTRLAERIGSSLASGPRKLERKAGARLLADVSASESLAITVPTDYVAVRSTAGARLTRMRPLSLYPGSIVVSITGEKHVPDGTDHTAPGTLLGRPTEWRGKSSPKGGFYFASSSLEQGKIAEVRVLATRQAKALDEMRAVAETLTVVKR